MDVANINRELQDEDATYALFKSTQQKDPQLAQQCYYAAEDLLARKGEYALCLSYIGDPQAKFETIRIGLELERNSQKRMAEVQQRIAEENRKRGLTNAWSPPDTSAMLKKSADDRFVGKTRQLIEILVATGHTDEAGNIRDQAISILDDARLKSAVSDAEKKGRK
jgi:hypothetical protein